MSDLLQKRYIKYTCNKCGWNTRILAEWASLKPKRCLGRKCKTSFIREPDQLDIEKAEVNTNDMLPAKQKKVSPPKPEKRSAKGKVSERPRNKKEKGTSQIRENRES